MYLSQEENPLVVFCLAHHLVSPGSTTELVLLTCTGIGFPRNLANWLNDRQKQCFLSLVKWKYNNSSSLYGLLCHPHQVAYMDPCASLTHILCNMIPENQL